MKEVWLRHAYGMRIGHGYDVHRLVEGRPLIIGGVEIPYEKGLLGHSDADVLTHAIIDALLGAAGLSDIGQIFPDSDELYKDISSIKLLEATEQLLVKRQFRFSNIDATIVAENPKLGPYIPQMVANIAAALDVPPGCINIKATTTEGLGFEGEGLGISAHAVTILGQ